MSNIIERNREVTVVDDALKEIKPDFVAVAGEERFIREIGFATQHIRRNPKILQCTTDSIREAVLNVALTGTTLNPALECSYLVPREGKCCLDFGYKGLIDLVTRDGAVATINAHAVYQWDEFDYQVGTEQYLRYKMSLENRHEIKEIYKEPKKIWEYIVCAFSIATLPNGEKDFVILPLWKLWKTYQTSKGKDNPKMPWQTFPEEQIRKTVLRYHIKTLPKNEGLARAVATLNEQDGLADGYKVSRGQELYEKFNQEGETNEDRGTMEE